MWASASTSTSSNGRPRLARTTSALSGRLAYPPTEDAPPPRRRQRHWRTLDPRRRCGIGRLGRSRHQLASRCTVPKGRRSTAAASRGTSVAEVRDCLLTRIHRLSGSARHQAVAFSVVPTARSTSASVVRQLRTDTRMGRTLRHVMPPNHASSLCEDGRLRNQSGGRGRRQARGHARDLD